LSLLHRWYLPQFAELGFTLLDTASLKGSDEFEQLLLPAHELGAGLTAATIVLGHRSQRSELLGRRGDVPGASFSAIGQDGAFMELTAGTAAVRFAALSPQGVDRAWEKRFPSEAIFEQFGELLLGLEELRAEGAELLVHGWGPGDSVGRYNIIPTDSEKSFGCGRKNSKKVTPSRIGTGGEATRLENG
jgi:hypothetical protein